MNIYRGSESMLLHHSVASETPFDWFSRLYGGAKLITLDENCDGITTHV